MHHLTLLYACLCLCVGCTQKFPPSDLYDRSSLADIELKYRKLFNLENEVQKDALEKLMDQMPSIRKGGADYQRPGTLSLYFDLRYMLDRSFSGGDITQANVRQYLIKKIGVVSSMVRFPRSVDVAMYLSPQDRFALTLEQIHELYGQHLPKYSSLTALLMKMKTQANHIEQPTAGNEPTRQPIELTVPAYLK